MRAVTPETSRPKARSLRVQGTKFAITGAIAAVIDVAVTWVFQIALGVFSGTQARTLGFAAGTLMAYLLNRRWTFQAAPSLRRLFLVVSTYGLTYLVNIVLYRQAFPFFDHGLGWASSYALFAAFCIAQGTATLINFIVQRWIIFRTTSYQRELA
ncbi:MAG: GtrA family protein [Corynebacterium sp.]|nr:GtrA family protein [Corynebacterium sp.]